LARFRSVAEVLEERLTPTGIEVRLRMSPAEWGRLRAPYGGRVPMLFEPAAGPEADRPPDAVRRFVEMWRDAPEGSPPDSPWARRAPGDTGPANLRVTMWVDPTDPGAQQVVLASIELADEPRGEIRITAPLCFGVKCLGPRISQFIQTYPDLRVELELDDRLVDIVEHKLDLAIRIGYPQDSTQVMRPFGLVQRYFCASPAYLRERGAPRVPSDLVRHACLHYSNVSMREEWTTCGEDACESPQLEGVFCSNNSEVLCEAACHGAGIALLPEFVANGPLGAGRLERVLEGFEPPPFTLYALYASRRLVPRKIRLLLDFLQENVSVGGECQRSGADAAAHSERQPSRTAGTLATAPKASSNLNA